MKKSLLIFLLFFVVSLVSGQQVQKSQNKAQLAAAFLIDKQYEKAGPLYLELFEETKMTQYLDNYLQCLEALKQYPEAIKVLKKQFRETKNTNYQIYLGFIYKESGDLKNSIETYDEVIENLPANNALIITMGNSFFIRREFEYSEKAYLKGRILLPGEMFHENLATVYAYQRNYTKMMAEYMALLKKDETALERVQSRINSLIQYDFDKSLQTTVKNEVIKGIQLSPETIVYNRLLIWIFILEEDYDQALVNAIALDKRTRTEEKSILEFSRGAAQNKLFDIALKGLEYLSQRKPEVQNIAQIKQEIVLVEFNSFLNTPPNKRVSEQALENRFVNVLTELGYKAETADLAKTYAHFLAFYRNNTIAALEVIDKAFAVKELNNYQRTLLKIEQADINVFDNNLWEATLLYAQIIDANKENTLGDEVKLKRAKVSFYLGDIQWTRAQLDALKASTSKLIANDAMELSLLITTNYDLDSLEAPIQQYARAELFTFQNNDSLALITYDSITNKYPLHSLSDEILMRKAEIAGRDFNFELMASLYQKVIDTYSYSTSADDATFFLAKLYEEKLSNPEKAQELYKKVLTNYTGSIYVDEARKKYRTLRGDKLEPEENGSRESLFFNGAY